MTKRFKPGQQVVCIHKGSWVTQKYGISETTPDPVFNEICTIVSYCEIFKGEWVLSVKGYETWYMQYWFEPLVTDAVLEKELSKIPQPVEL